MPFRIAREHGNRLALCIEHEHQLIEELRFETHTHSQRQELFEAWFR
jgi:hypothetical protein